MTPPPFAEWLADPNARPVTITDTGGALDWIAQAYSDDGVNEILATIEEHYGKHQNYLLQCSKDETIEGQWHVKPDFHFMSQGGYHNLRITFRTTSIYLDT